MSIVGSSLVKRGFEAHSYISEKKVKIELPPWVIAMLIVTSLVFMYCLFMVEYTFGRVIPTLILVESPQDNINFEPLPTQDHDGVIKNPEPTVSRPQFITSSFRRSIQHLKLKEGYRGRFRGLAMFIAHNMAVQWVAGALTAIIPFFLPFGLDVVVATVICAQLSLGWTLVVITEASPNYWFRRIPSFKSWKKIAGPTALYAIVRQIAAMIPLHLAFQAGLFQDPKIVADLPPSELKIIVIKALGLLVLAVVLSICLTIPAKIVLTRMQASLVNDAEETIVPFDRTFGGKVIPEIVGGTGMISMYDAWTTFDWSARIRLAKAYAKVTAMVFAVTFFFAFVLSMQCAIFAPQLHKVIVVAT